MGFTIARHSYSPIYALSLQNTYKFIHKIVKKLNEEKTIDI